jgi:hypothetical protein
MAKGYIQEYRKAIEKRETVPEPKIEHEVVLLPLRELTWNHSRGDAKGRITKR